MNGLGNLGIEICPVLLNMSPINVLKMDEFTDTLFNV